MSPRSVHAFAEKVALITDGTSRIGRAVALQLALEGAFVTVGYSAPSVEAENAINEMKALGTLAAAVGADVSTAAGARSLVQNVREMYGRLDLLVNCVNGGPGSKFEDISDEMFTGALNTNIKSAFFVTQAAVALMKERPKPKIVNIVSACDAPEARQDTVFSLTQSAVAELTISLADTLPKNFRINCVRVSEKETLGTMPDNDLFRIDKGVAADDVARAVLYLLSGEAIGLNGQILTIG